MSAAEDNTVRVWEVGASGNAVKVLNHHSAVHSMGVVGESLVTATKQGVMRVWNMVSGEMGQSVQAMDQDAISCMAMSDLSIWTGSLNGVLRCWDPLSLRPTLTVPAHKGPVLWIDLADDPKEPLLSGGSDSSIRVWWRKHTRTSTFKKKFFGLK